MTIEHEVYKGNLAKGWVMCSPKIRPNIWCAQQPGCHKDGVTLADVTNYNEYELRQDQKDALEDIAKKHDEQFPDHKIRVVYQIIEAILRS